MVTFEQTDILTYEEGEEGWISELQDAKTIILDCGGEIGRELR